MSDALKQDGDFLRLLGTLLTTHSTLQQQAARSVDTALVVRNWLFGWYVSEFEKGQSNRSELYGKKLTENLAQALTDRLGSAVGIPDGRSISAACFMNVLGTFGRQCLPNLAAHYLRRRP